MERLTPAERSVLTTLIVVVALFAAWKYWRIHEITHSSVPEAAWAESVVREFSVRK